MFFSVEIPHKCNATTNSRLFFTPIKNSRLAGDWKENPDLQEARDI